MIERLFNRLPVTLQYLGCTGVLCVGIVVVFIVGINACSAIAKVVSP